ncbi:MAG: hypothetical protein ACFE8J_18840, partial [Candidatus Heimdallarchaeota archaeon]
MIKPKDVINRFILFVNSHKQKCVLVLSIFCLIFVFFNIINLDNTLGLASIDILSILLQIIILLSTFFTVLFLPFYPLFFIIFKDKSFNF